MNTTNFTTATTMEDKLVVSAFNREQIMHMVITTDAGKPSLEDITSALHLNRQKIHLLAAKETLSKMLERIETELNNTY